MHPTLSTGELPPWIGENLGFVLAHAGALCFERFQAALEPLGIRPRHYSVLSVLSHRAEPSTQHLVAGCLQLDPSSLVDVLDELEARGLVRRERDPDDRRRNRLILTERGHGTLESARRRAAELEDRLFAGATDQDRQRLLDLLARLVTVASTPG